MFNRYVDLSPEDEGGVALLPVFLATRAVIRAHVAATRSTQAGRDSAQDRDARGYLALATIAFVAGAVMLYRQPKRDSLDYCAVFLCCYFGALGIAYLWAREMVRRVRKGEPEEF